MHIDRDATPVTPGFSYPFSPFPLETLRPAFAMFGFMLTLAATLIISMILPFAFRADMMLPFVIDYSSIRFHDTPSILSPSYFDYYSLRYFSGLRRRCHHRRGLDHTRYYCRRCTPLDAAIRRHFILLMLFSPYATITLPLCY